MDILLEDIEKVSSDLSASLATAWTHFYCRALPALEALFVHVKVGFPSYKNFLAEFVNLTVFLRRFLTRQIFYYCFVIWGPEVA
jgi:hypothetical protein